MKLGQLFIYKIVFLLGAVPFGLPKANWKAMLKGIKLQNEKKPGYQEIWISSVGCFFELDE